MNAPKSIQYHYIDFLIATQKVYSFTQATRVQPDDTHAPAEDVINRLLLRIETNSAYLLPEARNQVSLRSGVLVLNDSTLDKQYANKIELVSRHWSGKDRKVVCGINLITLMWSDGERYIVCDYRFFDKPTDGSTKKDHFRKMLLSGKERGFWPACELFDSWYGSLDNLKTIRNLRWYWVTQMKSNGRVDRDRSGERAISEVEIAESGSILHLKGYGLIKVFKLVAKDGDIEYWVTNKVGMTEIERVKFNDMAWTIESYQGGIKQFCGVERCSARSRRAQRNDIGHGLRAFLRLEHQSYQKGIRWFEAKTSIIREAVRANLAKPLFTL